MQPFNCPKNQTKIVDAPLTYTLETYRHSFAEQSFYLKVIPSLFTANIEFLGRIICIQKHRGLLVSQPPLFTSSVRYMIWLHRVLCFLPVCYGLPIHQLMLHIYSPTSKHIFFQLVFPDFHDIPLAHSKISTMWSRSDRRVMQLAAWTNAAWWLPFIRVQTWHWPLVLWLVWHNRINFCYKALSVF